MFNAIFPLYSNSLGSSSMASACGGSLALMDAGTKCGTYEDKLHIAIR